MLGRTRRIHFVGIGGIGMSGIAELLANQGYAVSGSDAKASDVTRRLETLGVRVVTGHAAEHVGDADVVVVSSAVRPTNPEVVAARSRGIPVIPRAEMLAELMRLKQGIAVAGAHGKTTTTSMVALLLDRAGLDPTAVIGGRLSAFGSNARLGQGSYLVAEADESDGSFLALSPVVAIVTNVDREHLDHYGSFEGVLDAFVAFANKVPFCGVVIACADDATLMGAAAAHHPPRRHLRHRRAPADVRADAVALEAFGSSCRVVVAGRELGTLRLSVPGRHNLLNALSAVAVGLELGLRFEAIAAALAEFRGAERRFQLARRGRGRAGRRRLRPPPDRDRRGHRRRPRRARAPPGRRLPAAPLHAHRAAAAASSARRWPRPTSWCSATSTRRRGSDPRRHRRRRGRRDRGRRRPGAGDRARHRRRARRRRGAGRARRSRDHARRRLDRHASGRRCSPPSRLAPAIPERPADGRSRRRRTSASSAGGSRRRARRRAAGRRWSGRSSSGRWSSASSATRRGGRWPWSPSRRRCASATSPCRACATSVPATSGRRVRMLDGPTSSAPISRRRAAGCSARRGSPTRRCAASCRRRSRSRSRSASRWRWRASPAAACS